MASTFDMDQTGPRMSSSQPTSPPPTQLVFSRASTGPRATPALQGSGAVIGAGGSMSGVPSSGVPTNEEIEAKIQAAMSSAAARLATNPPRDTRTQLFVGNLPYRVRWQDLKDLFRRSGTVLRADVSLGPDNRSRGYGTVLLATAEDAGRAMDMFNGYVWQTRTLEVRPDRMGLAGGVGNGTTTGTGLGSGANTGLAIGDGDVANGFGTTGFGATPNLGATMGMGLDSYSLSSLAGASGLGGLGGTATSTASTNGVNTPFSLGRLGSTSPFLSGDEAAGLAAQLARVASPSSAVGAGMSLHSPLIASVGGNGVSLNSPRSVHSQLTSTTAGGEKSRSLFVGNLPFHIQWQDLKDLFRQAGTILRADVALGPDGRSRGFGTVSFATEVDAERAVKMFNGYDFNGRQLKVHFDKFAAPSATAAPSVGLSMSAPQSPHTGSFASPHPALSHTPSFAQQILLHQQQQRLDQQRHDQHWQDLLNSQTTLQRVNTDQVTYKHPLPTNDSSRPSTNFASLESPPTHLTRARSDSVAQLVLHTQPPLAQPPLLPRHSEPQVDVPTHTLQPQASLHIALPPHHHPYPFDFSPGSPYGYGSYHTANVPSEPVADSVTSSTPSARLEREQVQPAGVLDTRNQTVPSHYVQEPFSAQPSISHSQESSANQRPPPPQATSSAGSQPDSQSSSVQNSQPATQVTSPAATSPQSATSSSLHSHPAHPGPIALPPPATTFPIPPSLSPVYHPQMSPYASPMHHPGMMMGMSMTPYGLPPITPSMPSFQFVPQPSPGPAPSGGSADLFSPPGASHGGLTPGGTLDTQTQAAGGYPSHLRQSHGPMLSPYAPFSPGVTMSPGAFWGRPGSSAVNPYINPAPGAPVHFATTGYFPPVPSQQMEEPQGYFPPFVSNSGSSATMRPTGLSNEIMQDGSSGSGSEGESTSGMGREEGGDAAVTVGAGKRPESTASEETTAGTGGRTDTETSTRPSSSNATSWNTDSANPSPSRAPELEKQMQALAIGEHSSKASAVLGAELLPLEEAAMVGPSSTEDAAVTGGHDELKRRPDLRANGTSVTSSIPA